MTMRVAYIAHSLVASRQALFAAELRRQLQSQGGDLLEVYPGAWGRHTRPGGWPVAMPGDIYRFHFPAETWRVLRAWKPDLLLIQQETACATAQHAAAYANAVGIPHVLFSWENAPRDYSPLQADPLRSAAWNVYGNSDAKALGTKHGADPERSTILPQIGFDVDAFSPRETGKEWDILFNGRPGDPMKGEAVLDAAVQGMPWRVAKGHLLGYAEYDVVMDRYRKAAVLCTPSLDVPGFPREQFAPAVNVEALLCGTPVLTSNQPAILEWLKGCPAAWFAQQGDPSDLREHLKTVLEGAGRFSGEKGRAWAVERFSNEAVAHAYVDVFQRALAKGVPA